MKNGEGLWNDAVNKKLKRDMEITENSKLIAEYLGWKYIPFNPEDKALKPGWYQVKQPKVEKVNFPASLDDNDSSLVEVEFDIISVKQGWKKHNGLWYRFVCRNHNELRFYNSMDALLPVIKRLEAEDLSEHHYKWEMGGKERSNFEGIEFMLFGNGGYSHINLALDPSLNISSSFDESLNWTQNTFNLVVDTIKYVNEVKNRKYEGTVD